VVSLQELKAEQEAFPVNALRTIGYEGGKLGTDGTFPSFLVGVRPVPIFFVPGLF